MARMKKQKQTKLTTELLAFSKELKMQAYEVDLFKQWLERFKNG